MTTTPWSNRQFANAMRKAGYKNHGQGCYIHSVTGKVFNAWTWTAERAGQYSTGEAWIEWAAVQQTPPPF